MFKTKIVSTLPFSANSLVGQNKMFNIYFMLLVDIENYKNIIIYINIISMSIYHVPSLLFK